jgi:hypothetical protein
VANRRILATLGRPGRSPAGRDRLLSGESVAGDCNYTKRNLTAVPAAGSVAAHTVVRNDANVGGFMVIISRGEIEKSSGMIFPGQQSSKRARVGELNICIAAQGSAASETCSYRIVHGTGSYRVAEYSEWSPNRDSDRVCDSDIGVSCSKSYHEQKQRWNTTFVITD